MVNLSLREAVKHFDVSRPTLQKALKSGKISGVHDGKGRWTIDPAEMARIYQPRESEAAKAGSDLPDNLSGKNTPLSREIETLRERLSEAEKRAAVAEALAEERGRHIDDLRRMLPAPMQPRRKWWPWGSD